MNQCRNISQTPFDFTQIPNETLFFARLGQTELSEPLNNQIYSNRLVFEVPQNDACVSTILSQAPQAISQSYTETLTALRSADSNHDHFVSPLEQNQFCNSQARGSRFESTYAFRQAADYYTNILPNYLATNSAETSSSTAVSALRTRLEAYRFQWSHFDSTKLQAAGLSQNWEEVASVYGLSLKQDNIENLLNRFRHDLNYPDDAAQIQPSEMAAIHLILKETRITQNRNYHRLNTFLEHSPFSSRLNETELYQDDGAPFNPDEYVLLANLLNTNLHSDIEFLGQRIVASNPENSPHQITLAEVLQLALANSPAPSQLRALRSWIKERNSLVDHVLTSIRNETLKSLEMFTSPANLLFMAGAYAYHHLQPVFFQFLYHGRLQRSAEGLQHFLHYQSYLRVNLQHAPMNIRLRSAMVNLGAFHYLIMPMLIGPILGGLVHFLTPKEHQNNEHLHLAIETAVNYFVGLPLIDSICRAGSMNMRSYITHHIPGRLVRPGLWSQIATHMQRNPLLSASLCLGFGLAAYLYLENE